MLRSLRPTVLLLVLAFAATAVSAQSLNEVMAMKLADVVQTSATQEYTRGYGFGAYAAFTGAVPTTAVVTLQSSAGTQLQLSRDTDGTYNALQDFSTRADMDAAYPDGTYTLTVADGGTVLTTTTFAFATGAAVTPTLITNYDALQGAPTVSPTITWQPIGGAAAQDFISLDVTRADGTDVYTSPDTTTATATSQATLLVNATPLTADLTYAKLIVTAPANGGPIVATGNGFNLDFSLSCNVQPPLIWQQPGGADLTVGQTYAITVVATATDTPTYQWYQNGTPIPNATLSSYTLNGVRLSDAGTYTVVVKNGGGSVRTDPAVITVSPVPPTIQTQPIAGASMVGQPLNLSVIASGSGTLTYQWFKDGTAVAGATGATFSVPALQPADGGVYTVKVTDASSSILSAPAAVAVAPSVYVSTYAGTGTLGAVDGPAATAEFYQPLGLARDAAGNLYVADSGNAVIRKITPDGSVSTFAGAAGQKGSVDGVLSDARFTTPEGLAMDSQGNLYVTDANAIRKITPAGAVTTLAGVAGQAGAADGSGAAARFNTPIGLAVDAAGNLYVADYRNDTIRKITPDGTVSTLAGSPGVYGSTDGFGSAALFWAPISVAVDASGNVFVGDTGSSTIRKIAPSGYVSAALGTTSATRYLADGIGVNAGVGGGVAALAVDRSGTLYWMESSVLRRLTPDGAVQTVAGFGGRMYTDGPGPQAGFGQAEGMVIDPSGTMYLTDGINSRLRKVTFGTAGSSPEIGYTAQPQSQTMAAGGTLVLTAPTSGYVAYGAWEKNGVAIAGATRPTLVLTGLQAADTGTYTYVAGNAAGTTASQPAVVNVSATATAGRLVNLSVRSPAGRAAETLLVGFAVAGPTGTKGLLARGIGPELATYGVAHPLPDPTLTLRSGSTVVAANDNWTADTGAVFSRVGAFPLTAGSADAALTTTLNAGTYTAEIGNKGLPGVAMAELYDLDPVTSTGPQLVNVSARSHVGTGDAVLIAGFAVLGDTSRTFLIRGVGPTLGNYGISPGDYLADPQLEVRDGANTVVAANDNWGGDANLAAAFKQVNAFPFPWNYSADAAVLVTLKPGLYTVKVSGVGNTTGVALVEVYAMP